MDLFTAVVGSVEAVRSDGDAGAIAPLRQGFVMVTVDQPAWDRVTRGLDEDERALSDLSVFFAIILRSCGLATDFAGPLLLLEQDDFRQSVLVRQGETVVDTLTTRFDENPPLQLPGADGAFNTALRRIGVRADGYPDECAALGLPLQRPEIVSPGDTSTL